MARQFTQKHYVAVADALVEAYRHPAISTSVLYTEGAHNAARLGINLVRAEFVRMFSQDATEFDCDKFHKHIETRLGRGDGSCRHGIPADGTPEQVAQCGSECSATVGDYWNVPDSLFGTSSEVPTMTHCPECNTQLRFEGGCWYCPACGCSGC